MFGAVATQIVSDMDLYINKSGVYITFNYIPEKRKLSGILCFRQQRSRRAATAVRRRITISLLAR